jgi:hypothetical protein
MVYLAQRYYGIPQVVRENSNYLAFLQVLGDVKRILNVFNHVNDIEVVLQYYSQTMSRPYTPFIIDNKKRQYRMGFYNVFPLPE